MIKFERNGIVYFCDTAEETAQLTILLSGLDAKDFPESDKTKMAHLAFGPSVVDADEKAEITKFINVIKNLPDSGVSGEVFARALGLEGVTGLGPRLAGLNKKLGKYGLSISKLMERVDRQGQPNVWVMNKAAIEKLNTFQ